MWHLLGLCVAAFCFFMQTEWIYNTTNTQNITRRKKKQKTSSTLIGKKIYVDLLCETDHSDYNYESKQMNLFVRASLRQCHDSAVFHGTNVIQRAAYANTVTLWNVWNVQGFRCTYVSCWLEGCSWLTKPSLCQLVVTSAVSISYCVNMAHYYI